MNLNYKAIKTGKELLRTNGTKTAFSLLDFWRWNASDLVSNTLRGRLAEFIVGSAIGVDFTTPREEWDNYDLHTPSGIKIEIKSSAYIQSWEQDDDSAPSFNIKRTVAYNSKSRLREGPSKRHADIYVFCLLKHKERDTIDPLNMDQWEFYVVITKTLDTKLGNQKSISLNPLRKLTEPISYNQLAQKIKKKGQELKQQSN